MRTFLSPPLFSASNLPPLHRIPIDSLFSLVTNLRDEVSRLLKTSSSVCTINKLIKIDGKMRAVVKVWLCSLVDDDSSNP